MYKNPPLFSGGPVGLGIGVKDATFNKGNYLFKLVAFLAVVVAKVQSCGLRFTTKLKQGTLAGVASIASARFHGNLLSLCLL